VFIKNVIESYLGQCCQFDYINRMITLKLITLNGTHCIDYTNLKFILAIVVERLSIADEQLELDQFNASCSPGTFLSQNKK
jgi:hypothetical protein